MRLCFSEAALLLNNYENELNKNDFSNFIKNCDKLLHRELLEKTIEMLLSSIMDCDEKELIKVVDKLSKTETEKSCSILLRKSIYLKKLSEK